LREASSQPLPPSRIADVLGRACHLWRDRTFNGRAATLAKIAANSGHSMALLDESLDALLANFTPGNLTALERTLAARHRLIGFIMPGNLAGAGIHEFVQALIAGCAVMVKPSSFEPFFFAEFHRTLQSIDPVVASRIEVTVWDRSDSESTLALASQCDRVAVFGEDDTVAQLAMLAGPKLIGFGSRLSAAVLAREAIAGVRGRIVAEGLARDVSLFDQRGCLSPHHIMVEAPGQAARQFAGLLAHELEIAARLMPPEQAPPMAEMTGARALRENARWRRIGGAAVELWEGENLSWTVIFDPESTLQASPLRRSVRVGVFENQTDLADRLNPVAGKLEGCAFADPAHRIESVRPLLRELGVSYFCDPGRLQSPPPSWAHGGGIFMRLLEAGNG
jgi:acyl-CoA reductase LuxC